MAAVGAKTKRGASKEESVDRGNGIAGPFCLFANRCRKRWNETEDRLDLASAARASADGRARQDVQLGVGEEGEGGRHFGSGNERWRDGWPAARAGGDLEVLRRLPNRRKDAQELHNA